jgi:hypothetical protein
LLPAAAMAAVIAGLALVFWPSALEQQARRIQAEVAEIRGRPFKSSVDVVRPSQQEWRAFIDDEMGKAPKVERYWDVARMVGVYRGPDRDAPEKIFAELVGFAAGAYDAYTHRFLLIADLPEIEQGVLFAHELYHGFQDQHFDLKTYLLDVALEPGANADLVQARRAVVEGEATYVDTIYQGRLAGIGRPTREQVAALIAVQGDWSPERWEGALADPSLDARVRAQLQQAIETRKRLPGFLFEALMSAYIDGPAFIHAIRARGWSEVEKLYGEYPPRSTEQVLHPEKWFAREEPIGISWPAFDRDPLFSDWKLLDQNVIGERAWQVVFREQELREQARSAAAGWNGDRYAVFVDEKTSAFLMLMYTSWDTPVDAEEFAAAYRRLLQTKHRDAPMPTRVELRGNEVLIVEGATAASLDAFIEFNRRATVASR